MWSLCFLKTSNQSLVVLKLSEMSYGDGGIATFEACIWQILRQLVTSHWSTSLSLGCSFLEIGKLVKSHANKVE